MAGRPVPSPAAMTLAELLIAMTVTSLLCVTLATYAQSVSTIWHETEDMARVTQQARVATLVVERRIEGALYVGQPGDRPDHLSLWTGDDDPADGQMNLNEIAVLSTETDSSGAVRLVEITHEQPAGLNPGYPAADVPSVLNSAATCDAFTSDSYAKRAELAEHLGPDSSGLQFAIFEEPDDQAYDQAAFLTFVDFRLRLELNPLAGGGSRNPERMVLHGSAHAKSFWREKFAASPQEVFVVGNIYSIPDGDTKPGKKDNTDFGFVVPGGAGPTGTFLVRNLGRQRLTLGAVTVPNGFTLVEGLSSSLTGGHSDSFTVQLDSAISGEKSGQISFATDDSDENPFNFTVKGLVLYPVREIVVTGKGSNIPDGKAAVSPSDGTDFGTVTLGGEGTIRKFKVCNYGATALTLGSVSLPNGFTLTDSLSAILEPGKSDTFKVRLDAITEGPKSGWVSFATNDDDENPFNFMIAGEVTP